MNGNSNRINYFTKILPLLPMLLLCVFFLSCARFYSRFYCVHHIVSAHMCAFFVSFYANQPNWKKMVGQKLTNSELRIWFRLHATVAFQIQSSDRFTPYAAESFYHHDHNNVKLGTIYPVSAVPFIISIRNNFCCFHNNAFFMPIQNVAAAGIHAKPFGQRKKNVVGGRYK